MDIQAIGLAQTSKSAPQPEPRGNVAARKPEPQQAPPPAQQKAEPTPQQLQQALQTINRKLSSSTSLEFSYHEGTKQTVVKVTDKETGDVIRQIPSEAALAIAESIGEFQKGMLLQQKA